MRASTRPRSVGMKEHHNRRSGVLNEDKLAEIEALRAEAKPTRHLHERKEVCDR
jgi:hypothetical protein